MKIWIVFPAYNEELAIGKILAEVSMMLEKSGYESFELVVVDDGSRDRTSAIVEDFKKATLIKHPVNRGLGAALRTGLLYAIKSSNPGDIILTTESDNTQETHKLDELIKAVQQGADIAIATPLTGGGFVGVPLYRRFLSRGGNIIYSLLFPVDGLHDYTNLVRAYKYSILKQGVDTYGEEKFLNKSGFEAVPDILLKLRVLKPKIVEIPIRIDFTASQKSSSMDVLKTIKRSLKLCISHLFSNH